jgi:ankyrin repeat protein
VNGLTPLDLAALAADPRNDAAEFFPSVARLLLEHGASLTIRGAVALGDISNVRKLIESNPQSLREIAPNGGLLTLAVNHQKIEIARLLLELGADVNERTLLHQLEEPVASYGMPLWYASLANNY